MILWSEIAIRLTLASLFGAMIGLERERKDWATGGGMYFAAFCATLLAIVILWVLQPFERKFSALFVQKSLKIVVSEKALSIAVIEKLSNNEAVDVSHFSVENGKNDR